MASKGTYYEDRKHFKDKWIRCSSCHQKLKFQMLENHVLKAHGVNALHKCPYCLGKVGWEKGQKTSKETLKHLVKCLREFMEKNCVPTEGETTTAAAAAAMESLRVEKDEIAVCNACKEFRPHPRQMNGRVRDRVSEYVGFYDSCFEKPDMWKTDWEIFDESKGMYNDLIGIFRRFLLPKNHPDGLIWWHLMVKHDVWDVFLKAMEKIKDEIVLLPYWCLCDGLGPDRVAHRHMILAHIPQSSFVKVWKNEVKYDLDMSGERCKYGVRIKNVFHLANCIQYVSQSKSSCDGEQIRDQLHEDKATMSHYHLNLPVSPHGIAFMCMLFEGGMEQLVILVNKNKNVVDWVKEAKKLQRRWAVPLKVTGFKYLNCVIPLRRVLEPSNEETCMYLTWMKHRRLFLKENEELSSMLKDEWYAYQVRKGNTFQTIGDEMYVYGPTQQNTMNQLVQQKKQLKREWVQEWEQRYKEMDEKYKKERMEKEALKLENKALKLENDVLKSFRGENSTLKQEIHDMKQEIYELKSMKQEIDILKRENNTLKDEINDLKVVNNNRNPVPNMTIHNNIQVVPHDNQQV